MSVTLVVTPSAARDVADAYADHSSHGQGDAFIAAVDRVFTQIADSPRMFPVTYANVHRALLRRFPYSAFFILEPDQAVILALHHQRRDPAARP